MMPGTHCHRARVVEQKTMYSLIRAFWNICMLRAGPQDLPASGVLFGLALAVNVASNIVVSVSALLDTSTLGRLVVAAFVETLVMLATVYLLLSILGHGARALQTLTALAGTAAAINVLAMPMIWISPLFVNLNNPFALLLVFLVLWSVVIVAHILRHALSITAIPAGLLAIGYTLLNFELSSQLLGLASN
jgi:hypothetical protein